jgi:hypothetical protein
MNGFIDELPDLLGPKELLASQIHVHPVTPFGDDGRKTPLAAGWLHWVSDQFQL